MQLAPVGRVARGNHSDLCGPTGLTTEAFVDYVAMALDAHVKGKPLPTEAEPVVSAPYVSDDDVDYTSLEKLFEELDTDKNGSIDIEELKVGLRKLGVLPKSLLAVNKKLTSSMQAP